METSDFYVLVEGPAWGDAQFYGEWLLAAAQAQAFWKQAIQDQQFAREFASHCERTRLFYKPDFDLAASLMLMELSGRCSSFLFDLEGELGEEFGIMVSMGFLRPGSVMATATYRVATAGRLARR